MSQPNPIITTATVARQLDPNTKTPLQASFTQVAKRAAETYWQMTAATDEEHQSTSASGDLDALTQTQAY